MDWQAISAHIEAATGQAFKLVTAQALGGGDINSAYHLQAADKSYFIKLNHVHLADMFAAEQAGLQELASTRTVKVPQPICIGVADNQAFLVLEYIDRGGSTKTATRQLGEQLAQLHRLPQAFFGWQRDNTIGSTPQSNTRSDDWCGFWRTQRLDKQLRLAARNGFTGRLQPLGEKLCADLDAFFQNYNPQASLLHGDLWGGNWAVDRSGQAVIFDPACYYGDREADLAMTELFGDFGADFYAAYQAVWPLDEGYRTRKSLYNLYHILNHLNLFGGGYLGQAERVLSTLLAELN